MATDEVWGELRALLEAEAMGMGWRLAALTETEREAFLDELTDRLCAKVHPVS